MANEATDVNLRTAAALAVKNALAAREAPRQDEYAQRWLALPEEARNEAKNKALQTLNTPSESVGRNAAQVVAAIAAIEIPVGQWANLIQQLLAAVREESERLRQSALQAIGFVCESVKSPALTAQSNEILTAVVYGARKDEPSTAVQLAAVQALLNSLEFISENFEREGERNYIMQVVCEATQSPDVGVKVASYECLVKIMQLYYHQMRYYMEQALFGVSSRRPHRGTHFHRSQAALYTDARLSHPSLLRPHCTSSPSSACGMQSSASPSKPSSSGRRCARRKSTWPSRPQR